MHAVLGRATTVPRCAPTPRSLCDWNELGTAKPWPHTLAVIAQRPCPTGHAQRCASLRRTPTALNISDNCPTAGRRLPPIPVGGLPRPWRFESSLPSRPRTAWPVTVTVTALLGLSGAYAADRLRNVRRLRRERAIPSRPCHHHRRLTVV